VIRSFGDPGDLADMPVEKEGLADLGRISGDSSGGVYFAFASSPNPTLRKYDRYGYLGYEASVPKDIFSLGSSQPSDRVEVSFGFSDVSLSNQTSGWVSLGSSDDLKFGGGVGMGLSDAIRRGFGPAAFQQTTSQPGAGGGPVGATFSGEVTPQGTNFQVGMGRVSNFGGRGRGRSNSTRLSDQSTSQGGVLQFASGGDEASDSGSSDWSQGTSSASGTTAELGMFGSSGNDPSTSYVPGTTNPAPGGLPEGFVFGSAIHFFGFRQGDFGGGGGGGAGFGGGSGLNRQGTAGMGHPETGTGSATWGTGSQDFSHSGYHGHFRPGTFAFTGVLRVNLGDLGRVSQADKPSITAMAADPETQEMWAGIGATLVHFSRDGAPMGIYYLALEGGTPLKPTALLVEADRIVVAADPWGIFEFARPDKPSSPQLNLIPQVTPPQ